MQGRDKWGSKIGFIFAVAGSAIGLGNIWRFPYIVGAHGGAAFIIIYLICLLLIGFPVLISEILIGRTAQKSPSGAFNQLGKSPFWSWGGKLTILTGFIVSSFYSTIAGWVLGYLVEAVQGHITHFENHSQAHQYYLGLIENPVWTLGFHGLFILLSLGVLYFGVRNGIERGNKVMMPLLFLILIFLVIRGLLMPNAIEGLRFLLTPDWSVLTPATIIMALGQSFFTLSIGQGTMVTYGSYLGKETNIVKSCVPIVLIDTLVALFAAIAVFTIVFSVGLKPDSGPGLIFQTLPLVFSQVPGGFLLACLFFLLVCLAALSSEISALEPSIAYLIEEKGWSRSKAAITCCVAAFIVGIPSALSFSVFKDYTLLNFSFLQLFDFIATSLLIPIGGLLAVLLVGWRWGLKNALVSLKEGAGEYFQKHAWLPSYFWICIKYTAPILILLVFLHALTQA